MDLTGLLNPVFGGDQCGQDLSFSPEFDEIAEARREDDASLDQGEWVSALKAANWPRVAECCATLLVGRSKDLRIAGWLMEAWAHGDGLAGVARGFRLIDGLCDAFWDGIHPLPEDDDQELRIGALAWVAIHAPRWLRNSPLTDSSHGRYGLADLEDARGRDRQPAQSAGEHGAAANGPVGTAQFETARKTTPLARFKAAAAEVDDCMSALDALEATLVQRLGDEAPGWSAVREVLDTLAATLDGFIGSKGVVRAPGEDAVAVSADLAGPLSQTVGREMTREQAIRQLREVAAFFRLSEPHSPVAYLAEKAARWGEMPLHDWLRSVVRDDGELARIEELLGLDAPGGADN